MCGQAPLRRRLLQLLGAGLAMLAVSFVWMAVVEATPASQRPYVGSSTDNTELGLTFSYNGFGRVGGQTGGPGQIPVGTGGVARKVSPAAGKPTAATTTHTAPEGPERVERLPNGRARNPVAFGGPTGPFRLFGKGLDDQGAWMLPFALAGLLAFALLLLLGDERRRRDARLSLLFCFGGWFVLEVAVLSLSKGIVHPYYVSALGPGVAAMVGAGAYAFAELAKRGDRRMLLLLLLPCGVAATVAVQLSLLHKAHYMPWFTAPLIVLSVLGLLAVALAVALARRTAPVAIALLLGALLIAPDGLLGEQLAGASAIDIPGGRPTGGGGPGRLRHRRRAPRRGSRAAALRRQRIARAAAGRCWATPRTPSRR